MTAYTGAEITEAHRRWEKIRIGPARRFELFGITHRLDAIRRDQVEGIRARRPGGLESYETRAAMRAAQNLASARKRRDRRGQKHGRPAPRGVASAQIVGFELVLPNYGRAMEGLAAAFRRLSVAAIAATDAFTDIRERVVLQQSRGGWTAELVAEDEMIGLGNEPILEQPDVGLCDGCESVDFPVKASDDGRAQFCPACLPAANGQITRETLMDVMQREC